MSEHHTTEAPAAKTARPEKPAADAAIAVSALALHDLVAAAAPYAKKDPALAAALAPFEA